MAKITYKVFISSTYLDNAERRKVVHDAVLTADMIPVGMERFTASTNPTVDECRRLAAQADVFVGIIAHRYGWIPDGHSVSITELEYDAAKDASKPRLMFILDSSVAVSPDKDFDQDSDRWAKQQKLQDFKNRFAADQMPAPFVDTSLGTKVLNALQRWRAELDVPARPAYSRPNPSLNARDEAPTTESLPNRPIPEAPTLATDDKTTIYERRAPSIVGEPARKVYTPYPMPLVEELEQLTKDRANPPPDDSPNKAHQRQERIRQLVSQLQDFPVAKRGDVVVGATLEAIIGKGNFGTVWRSTEEQSGEPRAVKIFDTDRLGLSQALYHFRRGVRAMEYLNQNDGRPSSIVKLYRVDAAKLAFSMKYMDGGDLTERGNTGWNLGKKVSVFKKICEAVKFAHDHQVLHRDIKPANIVMARSGEPTLTDFDIADLLFAQTRSAQVAGTVLYAAPEQLEGQKRRDATGDIYSLGRILHFLLLGHDPKIVFAEVPKLEELKGYPEYLVSIIRKCTLRDPDKRYQTVEQLLRDLAEHENGFKHSSVKPTDPITSLPPTETKRTKTKPAVSPQTRNTIYAGMFTIAAAMIAGFFTLIKSPTESSQETDTGSKSEQTAQNSPQPSAQETASKSEKTKTVRGEVEPLRVSIGENQSLEFAHIPAGTFSMGSLEGETGRSEDEGPQHQVTLTKGFYMQTTEVTQGQWRTVMGENPSRFKECGDTCPVERVSWEDARNFVGKLNQIAADNRYRLPTEAEWEYACRAGSTTRYYSGDSEADLKRAGWYYGNSDSKTHPAAEKQPNDFGLYDMHGNVWEWVEDDYHNNYENAPADGTDWIDNPRGKYRVLRGGSRLNRPGSCRSAIRGRGNPGSRSVSLGFRVVLDLK